MQSTRSTKWQFFKVSRFSVEGREEAKRSAPKGFTFVKATRSEFIFRRPHGTYVREQAAIAAKAAAEQATLADALNGDEELHNLPA